MEEDDSISVVFGAWEEMHEKTAPLLVHRMTETDAAAGPLELLQMLFHHATPELPIFRTRAFQKTNLPVKFQICLDFFFMSLLQRHGPAMFIPDVTMRVLQHAGQESRRLFRPEMLGSYLSDYELAISQFQNIDRITAMNLISNAMANQYVASALKAVEQGRYLIAREMLMRANVHCGGESMQAVAEFEEEHGLRMIVESLRGFIQTCPPVHRVVLQDDDLGRALEPVFAESLHDIPLEIVSAADLVDQGIEETDFLVYSNADVFKAVQEKCAFVVRKQRRIQDVAAAVRSHDGFEISKAHRLALLDPRKERADDVAQR